MTTIISSEEGFKCEKWFIGANSSFQTSNTDFDVFTLVKHRAANPGDFKITEKLPTLGQKLPGHQEMYLTDYVVSDDAPGLHEIRETYKGFADDNQRYKSPISRVSQNTNTIPIDLHVNYTNTKFSWGPVFGEGDSPNEFGRILEDGKFLKFGPVPDGQDGRQGHYAPCTKKNSGPHCRLMGVTDFLGAGQLKYTYSILSKNKKNHGRLVGKIIAISGGDPPELPDFRGNESDWLLTSFNSNAITLGSKANQGVFYRLEYEFLSSLGGWNRLIYQDGSTINLSKPSTMSWE
jgi:hypothetical protein